MLVVSDTSPVRALNHLGFVPLLARLYGEVVVPPAVMRELESPRREFQKVEPAALALLHVVAPSQAEHVAELREELDVGESEAVAVALELGASGLLIDERQGRAVARRYGLRVIGTLGVLHQAKLAGLVAAVRPHVLRLVEELDFFLNRDFVEQFLRQIGE